MLGCLSRPAASTSRLNRGDGRLVAGERRRQDLQRHDAAQPAMPGLEDHAHAALRPACRGSGSCRSGARGSCAGRARRPGRRVSRPAFWRTRARPRTPSDSGTPAARASSSSSPISPMSTSARRNSARSGADVAGPSLAGRSAGAAARAGRADDRLGLVDRVRGPGVARPLDGTPGHGRFPPLTSLSRTRLCPACRGLPIRWVSGSGALPRDDLSVNSTGSRIGPHSRSGLFGESSSAAKSRNRTIECPGSPDVDRDGYKYMTGTIRPEEGSA